MGNTFYDKPQLPQSLQSFQSPQVRLPPPSPPQAPTVEQIERDEPPPLSDDNVSDSSSQSDSEVDDERTKEELKRLMTDRNIILGTYKRMTCAFLSRGQCQCKARLDKIISTGITKKNILRFHAYDEMGNYIYCNKALRACNFNEKLKADLRKEIRERVQAISKPGYRIASVDFVRRYDLYNHIVPTPGLGDTYDARLLALTGNTTNVAFSFLQLKVPDPLNEDAIELPSKSTGTRKWKSPRLKPKIK